MERRKKLQLYGRYVPLLKQKYNERKIKKDAFVLELIYIFREKRLFLLSFLLNALECWWTVFRQILILSLILLKTGNFGQRFKQQQQVFSTHEDVKYVAL